MKKCILAFTLFSLLLVGTSSAQPPPSGSPLVINEVDYDQPSSDDAEFIELKNVSSLPIQLSEWEIVLFNGNPNIQLPYDSIALPNLLLAADDYFVVCGTGSLVPNCDLYVTDTDNFIENGNPDGIGLKNVTLDSIFDALSYEGNCPAPYIEGTGVSEALAESNSQVYTGLSRFPDGVDSDNNAADFRLRCITPGFANGTDSLSCNLTTGIKNISKEEFSIFPNPTKDKLNISLDGFKGENIKIAVYDITGRIVKDKSLTMLSGKGSLLINDLPEGVYILKLNNGSKELVKKFTVMK